MRRYLTAFALYAGLLSMALTPRAAGDSDVGGRCSTTASDITHGDFEVLTDGGFAGHACGTVRLTDGGTNPPRSPCVPCTASTFSGLRAGCVAAFRAANCP